MLIRLSKLLLKTVLGNSSTVQWKVSNGHVTQLKFQRYSSLVHKTEELSIQTLVFELEGALLKSSSLFPYFMLVAFEAVGFFRALILFLLYPFVCLVNRELGLKIMVFLCFVGIKKERFRVSRAVLPKFFLEHVAHEGYDVVMRFGRKIGVSNMPRIMVEGFLKDYVGVEAVVGRELKEVWGYYVGLMEEKKASDIVSELLGEEKLGTYAIGIGCFSKSVDQQLFTHCKEVYLVTKAEKREWQILPREKYQKPLIFHDGRLAFRPTPLATLAMFIWLPFGFFLFLIRLISGILLPYKISSFVLSLTGMRITISIPQHSITFSSKNREKPGGMLYVCNHRTLLDPIAISLALNKSVTAVIYSLSRFNELISPIRTVRLTRDREKDGKMMEKMLSQGDLVVCPEGTTCREPYLLRFSPLFAEMSDDIVPVAIDVQVTMFYGSTASGHKFLDPFFQFSNPYPVYFIKILDKLPSSQTCNIGGKSRFEVANHVQHEIAKALGFECTSLTRKDKYMILAGNDGVI